MFVCIGKTGGTGDGRDVLVGDTMIIVGGRVRGVVEDAFIDIAPLVYEYLFDIRTLFIDFEYFVHDIHRAVLLKLLAGSSASLYVKKSGWWRKKEREISGIL